MPTKSRSSCTTSRTIAQATARGRYLSHSPKQGLMASLLLSLVAGREAAVNSHNGLPPSRDKDHGP